MINIDLTDRIYKALGYIPSGMPQSVVIKANIEAGDVLEKAISKASDKRNQSYALKNITRYAVMRNDKCFADLTLRNGTQEFRFKNGIMTENMPDILAPCPVLQFKREKNIIKTAVDGSDSEVIECFGCKSWEIIIEGILIDLDAHEYPSDKVVQIRQLFEINDILEVVDNQVCEDLGIQSLYIEKIENLRLVEGFNDTLSYKLTTHSIKPIEFFI
ncbi:MAG: DUF6046 domain-containing protein [Bacteroidales bacterium]